MNKIKNFIKDFRTLLAASVFILLVGCGNKENKDNRFIVSNGLWTEVVTVRDNKYNKEYILVQTGHGVCLLATHNIE